MAEMSRSEWMKTWMDPDPAEARQSAVPDDRFPDVDPKLSAEIRAIVDKGLENIGKDFAIVGPAVGKFPSPVAKIGGLTIAGASRLLKAPETRKSATDALHTSIVRDIQDQITKAKAALGQQQFLNGGGLPGQWLPTR